MFSITSKVPRTVSTNLQIDLLADTTLPGQALLAIEQHFQDKMRNMAETLLHKANSMTIQTDESMSDYLQRRIDLRSQLTDAKVTWANDDTMIINFILNGIQDHPKYKPFREAMAFQARPQTIPDLGAALLRTEAAADKRAKEQNSTRDRFKHVRGFNRHNNNDHYGGRGQHNNRQRQYNNNQHWNNNRNQGQHWQNRNNKNANNNRAANGNAHRNQNHAHEARVHFDPEIPSDNAPAPHPREEDFADDHSKFILDSAAAPSHINYNPSDSSFLTTPVVIETPNGTMTASRAAQIDLQFSELGKVRANAIVNDNMPFSLAATDPIVKQLGPIILSKTSAKVIPWTHPLTPKILDAAKPIATKSNGLYELHNSTAMSAIQQPSLPRSTSHTEISSVTPNQTPLPSVNTPSAPYAIPFTTFVTPTATPHQPPEYTSNKAQLRDAHLHMTINHTSSKTIAKTMKMFGDSCSSELAKLSCSACSSSKAARAPHFRTSHNYEPGEALTSPVKGPLNFLTNKTIERYFVSCLDVGSRYAFCIPIQSRAEVPDAIQTCIELFSAAIGRQPAVFHSDNAAEYTGNKLQSYLKKSGIHFDPSTPYCPEENGLAERFNRTITEAARTALQAADMDDAFWPHALSDATDKYNNMHHSAIDAAPSMKLCGWKRPSLYGCRHFGQGGYIPILPRPANKLAPNGKLVQYLGRFEPNKVSVLDANGKILQVRKTDFKAYYPNSDPTLLTPACFPPDDEHGISTSKALHAKRDIPTCITETTPPPRTKSEAMKYPDWPLWKQAIDAELDKIDKRSTLEWLRARSKATSKPLPLLLRLDYKRDEDGRITERKARFTLRGDLMVPHVHFNPDHTAAPMACK